MTFPKDENEREIEINSFIKRAWWELDNAMNVSGNRPEHEEIKKLYDAVRDYLKARDARKYGEKEAAQ